MATLVATADPATGTVLVQVEQTIARDTFTRVVGAGWGSPTVGPAYVLSAAAAQYAVTGTVGTINANALSTDFTAVLQSNQNDHDIQVNLGTNTISTGGTTNYGVVVRYTDANNYWRVTAQIVTGTGAVTLSLVSRVGGTNTTVTTVATGFTITTDLTIRARACGNRVMARIWQTSTPEPTSWQIDQQYPALLTGTFAGAVYRRNAGNATPTTVEFDNLVLTTADGPVFGDSLRMYRVDVDGVETEVRGSPFSTNPGSAGVSGATATFWDNEAPFDTNIFYRVKSACGETVLTSNTISLTSSGMGWIRDPADPTNNFTFDFSGSYDDCVDQDLVVFSGFDDIEYANASGIFDIVDAARPNTVAQTRKNHASGFFLTSFSLDDILTLEDIFAPGTILLLSIPVALPYGWAQRTFGSDYITIGDIVQSFIGRDQRVTARIWSIPYRLSPPSADTDEGGTGGNGIGGGSATYDDLATSVLGATYNSLTAAATTYDAVAAGTGY